MFCIAPGIKWNGKETNTHTHIHLHTYTHVQRGGKGREGVVAIFGCSFDYIWDELQFRGSGQPVTQILGRQPALDSDLEAGRHRLLV